MKRIGFFGGTFDPIHFGHLNLAINLLEKTELEGIIFCPSNYSPAKSADRPLASGTARKEMLQLAIDPIDEFSILEKELQRDGPSFTIDTIRALQGEHPDTQFRLILGEDMLKGLENWKEVEELLSLAPPLVGTRPNAHQVDLKQPLKKWVEKGRVPVAQMEISSTLLRTRLAQKIFCGHLIPSKVLDYISLNALY